MPKKLRVFDPVCMGVVARREGSSRVGEPICLLEMPYDDFVVRLILLMHRKISGWVLGPSRNMNF